MSDPAEPAPKSPAVSRLRAIALAAAFWLVNIPLLLGPALMSGRFTLGAAMTVSIFLVGGPLFCVGLYYWLRAWSHRPRRVYLAAAVAGVVVAAVLLGAIDAVGGVVSGEIGEGPQRSPGQILVRVMSNTTIAAWMFGIVVAAMLLFDFGRQLQRREEQLVLAESRTAQARATATAARLEALRYQLNPHFLFNTLNAVSSAVITRRNDEAETMLARLASFLRTTLTAAPTAFVRIEDELGTVEAYLEIEAERFRDRLHMRIDCPPALRDALVPGFILQPLIENAMKHGVSRSRATVTVHIAVARRRDDLVVQVTDDARPLGENRPAPGGGIGLSAVRERLEVLYGPRASLGTERLDPGFQATITLPLTLDADQRKLDRCAS